MIKKILFFICIFSAALGAAQNKGSKTKIKKATVDSTGASMESEEPLDPMEALEASLPMEIEIDPNSGKKVVHKDILRRNDSLRKDLRDRLKKERMTFRVWTQHPNPKAKEKERKMLCINIVHKDTSLIYKTKDSVCVDPENFKLLHEYTAGDSTYMLIYIDAFTKDGNELCGAGHETKLYFVRWNTKTMEAKWKFKNICSCSKAITLMTKRKVINEWDKKSPLQITYNRGMDFMELKYDPANPKLGIQMLKDDSPGKKE